MRIIGLTLSALLACGAAFAQETETTPAPRAEPPLPEKITLPETPGEGPIVTIRRQENGDSVQEYRENGRLTMVKVTTPAGITYTLLDTNGDGLLDKSDHDGPVGPVYYTIYKWN